MYVNVLCKCVRYNVCISYEMNVNINSEFNLQLGCNCLSDKLNEEIVLNFHIHYNANI